MYISTRRPTSRDKREVFPTKICTVFGSTLRKMQDFSVNSRSAGPLGSSINVLFLIIHIWWSVSAFFPGSCWTARSSGPRWTERSAGKIDLRACVVFTLCSKPRNTQAHVLHAISHLYTAPCLMLPPCSHLRQPEPFEPLPISLM